MYKSELPKQIMMLCAVPDLDRERSSNSVENIIHLDRSPPKFWGPRLQPKSGKSALALCQLVQSQLQQSEIIN